MRYETRWSNGFWKVFDILEYTSTEVHYIRASAEAATTSANERAAAQKAA